VSQQKLRFKVIWFEKLSSSYTYIQTLSMKSQASIIKYVSTICFRFNYSLYCI